MLQKIVNRIQEAEARKSVVLDILSFETHPAEVRRYKAELKRLNERIWDGKIALKNGIKIRAGA